MLAACGGGGGAVSSTPTPTSTASTTTTTTTTTTATTGSSASAALTPSTTNVGNINYDDAEYRRSNAAVSANALAAYTAGASGTGVRIAILDSGLSDVNGQFTGRIAAASTDIVSNRGITDSGGHGTSVAAVAAAGRNGSDILGVAFNATLLIGRTDTVDSCASTDGCKHADSALARGVDFARTNGARVINISLGGSAANATLVTAVRNAVAAGIVVVISAGNDGGTNPDEFAQLAGQTGMNGMVIIAGSTDANGAASTYSNKAGSFSAYYLSALGERVRAFDNSGTAYLFTGTSYSAPAISGAVAVLAQAFPNLTGKQIVDLLYSTATDAGDAGTDATYGRGVLNLGKAFQPQGSLSLAGSAIPVSTATNATLGSAMGDASQGGTGQSKSGASAQAVFLDGYGRAYTMNLAGTIDRQPAARPLFGALSGDIRATSLAQGRFAMSLNVARNRAANDVDSSRLNLDPADARIVRMISGRVLAQIDRRTQVVFGFAEGAGRLAAMLDGRADLPFIAAKETDATPGFAQRDGHAFALRRDLGFAGVTVAGESGAVQTGLATRAHQGLYNQASIRFDRKVGPVALSAGLGLLRENGTVLGSRFGGAFGGGGATTRLIDARAQWDIGSGWSLAVAARQGWTAADSGTVLARGRLSTNAFSFDLGHVGMRHRFGLRIAQPMRVESGGFLLSLPTSYDYETGAVGYARQSLSLAPKGRELDIEAAYGLPLLGGWIDANLFLRRQPGNIATLPADKGAALRYAMNF